jgi:L-ascorbate metabolism protein UlaG (beta-lactamase superfamily)
MIPERASDPPSPKHFAGTHFYNPDGSQTRGFRDVLRWKLTSHADRSPRFVADVQQSVPPRTVEGSELRATLVNHSTVLLQQSGSTILTDPIWSKRASPLSWIGPSRRRAPGVRQEDLPRVDVVLLSHDHYDHLDLPTLRWLAHRGDSAFVVPKGVARLLRSEKVGPLYELDWGDACTISHTTISCVPAIHFSGRGLSNRNETLWCGYVISGPSGMVYFAGDTAFSSHFSDVRTQFGSPRLALLPIGAYEPRWFMSSVHMGPEEALQAHDILGAGTSIAIHHGTFQLADDGLDTARRRIEAASPPDSFLILANGQAADVA